MHPAEYSRLDARSRCIGVRRPSVARPFSISVRSLSTGRSNGGVQVGRTVADLAVHRCLVIAPWVYDLQSVRGRTVRVLNDRGHATADNPARACARADGILSMGLLCPAPGGHVPRHRHGCNDSTYRTLNPHSNRFVANTAGRTRVYTDAEDLQALHIVMMGRKLLLWQPFHGGPQSMRPVHRAASAVHPPDDGPGA